MNARPITAKPLVTRSEQPYAQPGATHFVPSSSMLDDMIARAMAKFDAHRQGIADEAERLRREEIAERAFRHNRRLAREQHEINLIKGARQRGYKCG